MKANRYVFMILFVGIVVPVGSIFFFNFILDPYHLWHRDSRVHQILEMNQRARLSKAYEVRRMHPKHIVLGSSRCLLGIDINHSAWPEGPRYNLAAFGAGMDENWAYLRHTQKVEALDTVVLGLDFFSFNARRTSWLPSYEHVLSYRDSRAGWQFERLRITISTSTLQDSWQTLKMNELRASQTSPAAQTRAPKKYLPMRTRAAFERSVKNNVRRRYTGMDRAGYSWEEPGETSTLEFYRRIIAFCHTNEIDLKLFISPMHAVQMEVIYELGLWDSFEQWKRHLVDINEKAAQRAGRPPFAIWDFSGYNRITSETIPPPEEKDKTMDYFFDSDHFTYEVGDMILDTLFDKNQTPGFGKRLTTDTVEQVLTKIRADRTMWREQNPDDYEEFRILVQEHRPKNVTIRTGASL